MILSITTSRCSKPFGRISGGDSVNEEKRRNETQLGQRSTSSNTIQAKNFEVQLEQVSRRLNNNRTQVSLVICGRDVLSFWTANPEFAIKKFTFDWKLSFLTNYEM